MNLTIVEKPSGTGETCRSILAELPEWFGIPESNADYARQAEQGPAWIAEADGPALGLMVLKTHGPDAVEIVLLAVPPKAHRRGLGRALVETAVSLAAARGARYLTVKTQGPSRDYAPYARTRAFYLGVGFAPLEEFSSIWGPEIPCLFMVRPVNPPPTDTPPQPR